MTWHFSFIGQTCFYSKTSKIWCYDVTLHFWHFHDYREDYNSHSEVLKFGSISDSVYMTWETDFVFIAFFSVSTAISCESAQWIMILHKSIIVSILQMEKLKSKSFSVQIQSQNMNSDSLSSIQQGKENFPEQKVKRVFFAKPWQ